MLEFEVGKYYWLHTNEEIHYDEWHPYFGWEVGRARNSATRGGIIFETMGDEKRVIFVGEFDGCVEVSEP